MTIQSQWLERNNRILYAENYARLIHFLRGYSRTFDCEDAQRMADELIQEALEHFYVPDRKMLRSHTGELRYDCVDGLGLLYLAIFEKHSPRQPGWNSYF